VRKVRHNPLDCDGNKRPNVAMPWDAYRMTSGHNLKNHWSLCNAPHPKQCGPAHWTHVVYRQRDQQPTPHAADDHGGEDTDRNLSKLIGDRCWGLDRTELMRLPGSSPATRDRRDAQPLRPPTSSKKPQRFVSTNPTFGAPRLPGGKAASPLSLCIRDLNSAQRKGVRLLPRCPTALGGKKAGPSSLERTRTKRSELKHATLNTAGRSIG